jgi:o-succinylbenzoate synthase
MLTPIKPLLSVTPLKIHRAEGFGLRLPMKKPVLMAGVRLEHSENWLIRLEAEDGQVGWGEASSAPNHGGSTVQEMHQAWHALQPTVLGADAMTLGGLTQALAPKVKSGKSVLGALDMALHDLVGRHLGVPAHVLLGGMRRDTVSPLWLLGTGSRDSDLAEARLRFAEGYRFFKLKVGVRPLEEEIEMALALRQDLGESLRLCADANMGMTADQAIAYARGVQPARLEFFEQPLAREDLDGLRRLIQTRLIDVGLDESITSAQDLLSHAALGAAGGSLKTLKLGGMSGVVAAGQVCQAHGQCINLAGKIAETSIASAAVIHLAAVLPNVDWGVSPSQATLKEDITAQPLSPQGGLYQVSQRPGLGVDVDEAAVRRFAFC